jgi:hypothetical protein
MKIYSPNAFKLLLTSSFLMTIFLAIFFSLIATQAQAGIRQYSADLNSSNWQLANDSRLQCTLAHQIPHYGQARFSAKASRKLNMEFELDMMLLPDSYSLAKVRSESPKWRPGYGGRVLADMKLY